MQLEKKSDSFIWNKKNKMDQWLKQWPKFLAVNLVQLHYTAYINRYIIIYIHLHTIQSSNLYWMHYTQQTIPHLFPVKPKLEKSTNHQHVPSTRSKCQYSLYASPIGWDAEFSKRSKAESTIKIATGSKTAHIENAIINLENSKGNAPRASWLHQDINTKSI